MMYFDNLIILIVLFIQISEKRKREGEKGCYSLVLRNTCKLKLRFLGALISSVQNC